MSPDALRRLALSLPQAEEAPHFESASFRVRGKIFATLSGKGDAATVKLPLQIQDAVTASCPAATPATGYWGRQGWTVLAIGAMEDADVADLLRTAWRQVAPKRLLAAEGL